MAHDHMTYSWSAPPAFDGFGFPDTTSLCLSFIGKRKRKQVPAPPPPPRVSTRGCGPQVFSLLSIAKEGSALRGTKRKADPQSFSMTRKHQASSMQSPPPQTSSLLGVEGKARIRIPAVTRHHWSKQAHWSSWSDRTMKYSLLLPPNS